ncbi:1075_t:CDS:2 [Dentiscutata erythropus]|uniref:1075_t:CDS:1 n=1 Tax=Dentiscutata erythropus TaxID=1348616 RepID=A0A9N9FZN9_9GLOM|nr:1075_t:CDS:2 [Dentiscutata erythropus]
MLIVKNLLKYHDYIPELVECSDQENKRTQLDKNNLDIASNVDPAVELNQTKGF